MKKFLKILMIASLFLMSGCGSKSASSVLKDMEKKLDEVNSYYVEGNMEIINHEDTYRYHVKVSYQKPDYYRIELVNDLNNHEQVILRNNDGVYVVTPSLNKSFKFQSDWPYNNSQVYLLHSIIEDLKEDEKRDFKKKGDGYFFSSQVSYPNNKSLVSQYVYVNKDGRITKTEVVDKDGNAQIIMDFKKIDYNKKFDKKHFELSSLLNMNQVVEKKDNSSDMKQSSNNSNDANHIDNHENKNSDIGSQEGQDTNQKNSNQENNSSETKNTKATASISDIVYPMYLPSNTYLTGQEKVTTKDGERLILTFGGDSSFVLVEETSTVNDFGLVVPVNGDFDFLTDVIGIIGSHSLSWHSNGIDYYLASDVIEVSELIDIARSISVLPVSK